MFEFKISGDTPQRFVENVLNGLGMFARIVQPRQAQQPVVTPPPQQSPQIENFKEGDPVVETNPLTGQPREEVKRKTTTRKTTPKIKATDPVPEADAPVDGTLDGAVDFLGDLGDEPPKTEAPVTLEDVRASVRAYNAAVSARNETLEQGVAKITPLFQKWKIKKVSDLKETQYAAFKAELQPYIDGTA